MENEGLQPDTPAEGGAPEAPAAPVSLRDTLTANLEQTESKAAEAAATPSEEKPGRTAGRPRDEQGRLLPGKVAAATAHPTTQPVAGTEPPAATPVVAASPQRPSSWKKDHWAGFDKIAAENPQLAEYINQREREYSQGVSTYKAEAENARSLNEAVAPFMQSLQQNGIQPAQWITNLGTAHHRLVYGSPQEKVMLGAQLIRDYRIDPQQLFAALQQPAPPPQAPAFDPRTIDTAVQRKVDEEMSRREVQSAYQNFLNAKDDQGQAKYPHFEAVKETMAGLLQAGLAQDYPGAYEAALRHPSHNEIFQQLQNEQKAAEELKNRQASQIAVNRARSQTISPRGATPSPQGKVNGKTSLRDTLSSAFDDAVESRV